MNMASASQVWQSVSATENNLHLAGYNNSCSSIAVKRVIYWIARSEEFLLAPSV